MIVSAEKMFEFALPDAFVAIVNSAQSNEMSMDYAAANSEMEEATNAESVSLFTVTENDFAQMARFDYDVQQLKSLMDIYMKEAYHFIHLMRIGSTRQRDEAMHIHRELEANIDDVDRFNNRYFDLCRNMKNFCVKIDELTRWYVAAVDEVAGLLDEVAAAGFKYSNLADAFAQSGKDIRIVENFFDRWLEMATKLANESQSIENAFRRHYEYCNNDLPRKIQSIPPKMEHLNNVIRQNPFVQFLMAGAHYNGAMNMMRGLTNNIEHMSLPALNNMIIYLSHIGTYYNGIAGDIQSTKNWLLNANDAKFMRTAAAQLSYSKAAWLACEDASQCFIRASARFIR